MSGTLAGLLTAFVLYVMLAVPFAVWAGRSAYAGSAARGGAHPGLGRAFWFVALPLALLVYGSLRGYSVDGPTYDPRGDENGQLLFLTVPPCIGMIVGYLAGWAVAWRRRNDPSLAIDEDA